MFASVDILGTRVDLPGLDDLRAAVRAAIAERRPTRITYAHFDILLQARTHPGVRACLVSSGINHHDGLAVCVAARLRTRARVPRLNGSDLYPLLLDDLRSSHRRVLFIGGLPGADTALRARWDAAGGTAADIAFLTGHESRDEIVTTCAAHAPDIVFVGLGSPLQFQWILTHAAALKRVPVVLAVGAGIDFLAGLRPRAPRWMRAAGLEWLHRLALEPARLWRRYLLGIPRFTALVIAQTLRGGG